MNKMFRAGILVALILSAVPTMAKSYYGGSADYNKGYNDALQNELNKIDASIPKYDTKVYKQPKTLPQPQHQNHPPRIAPQPNYTRTVPKTLDWIHNRQNTINMMRNGR